MKDLRESLLANSIRMHSLYHTALALCSVQRLNELVEELLPRCITAMDVTTACLITRGNELHTRGSRFEAADTSFLEDHSWSMDLACQLQKLPSGKQLLACAIVNEQQHLGTLIVVDKEALDFDSNDSKRIRNLASICSTALANVYEYEDLLQRTESLEEDLRQRDAMELERLRQELADATATQQSLLPKRSPSIPGLEIAGVCLPAKEVGGDFYDYVPLEGDSLALVLADVCGKGMRGAMYAVLSYGILHAEAKLGIYPHQMLWILNQDLQKRLPARILCAMGIGVLDLKSGKLRYSNAGMPYPIVKRGKDVFEIESNGVPLGGMREYGYDDVELDLQVGDTVVFLSDGITECAARENPEHLYLETTRAFDLLTELDGNESAESIASAVLRDTSHYSGLTSPQDDQTVVTVKVRDAFWNA